MTYSRTTTRLLTTAYLLQMGCDPTSDKLDSGLEDSGYTSAPLDTGDSSSGGHSGIDSGLDTGPGVCHDSAVDTEAIDSDAHLDSMDTGERRDSADTALGDSGDTLDTGDSFGTSTVAFQQVSAGNTFSCGIESSGTLSCWGSDTYSPPEGDFLQVSILGGGCATAPRAQVEQPSAAHPATSGSAMPWSSGATPAASRNHWRPDGLADHLLNLNPRRCRASSSSTPLFA